VPRQPPAAGYYNRRSSATIETQIDQSHRRNMELHAFLYSVTPGSGGVIADLGTLGGSYGTALAINTGGQIVGQSRTVGDARSYTPARPVWDGRMIDSDGWLDANTTRRRGQVGTDRSYSAERHWLDHRCGQLRRWPRWPERWQSRVRPRRLQPRPGAGKLRAAQPRRLPVPVPPSLCVASPATSAHLRSIGGCR
jgi:uncharacterized membrane protein